jgi:hypothetical protein
MLYVRAQGSGVMVVDKKGWLRDNTLAILQSNDEWLNAPGIAERIKSRFGDAMFHWNAKSLTPILRIMVRDGEARSEIIKGRVHYRRKDEA